MDLCNLGTDAASTLAVKVKLGCGFIRHEGYQQGPEEAKNILRMKLQETFPSPFFWGG